VIGNCQSPPTEITLLGMNSEIHNLIYTSDSDNCWAELGPHAQKLWHISRQNLPTPAWWVINSQALALSCNENQEELQPLLSRLNINSRLSLEQTSFQLQQLILEQPLPKALQIALNQALPQTGQYLVHAEFIAESKTLAAFNPPFKSLLCVQYSEIENTLKQCWASLFNERMLVALCERAQSPAQIKVAVLIQKMVDSRAWGAVFTANPLGDLNELVISAGYGWGGESDLRLKNDTYRFQRDSQSWELEIEEKREQLLASKTGELQISEVRPVLRSQAVLSRNQREELLKLALQAESTYLHHQDLEWLQDQAGNFWLIQARPIASIPQGQRTIFDKSFVSESLTGITSPLSFSFLRQSSEVILRNTLLRLGAPTEQVFAQQSIFRNLLGHLQGRVYYNLSHWQTLTQLLAKENTENNALYWQKLFGLNQNHDETHWLWPNARKEHKITQKMLAFFWHLDREMKAQLDKFEHVQARFKQSDLQDKNAHQLLEIYTNLNSELLYGWETILINQGLIRFFTNLSRQLLKRAGFKQTQSLMNDLLCGQVGHHRMAPVRSLVSLAEFVRNDSDLSDFLQRHSQDPEIIKRLSYSHFEEFHKSLSRHLEEFGDRMEAELKLETPSLHTEPEELIHWILNCVPTKMSLARLETRQSEIRAEAEKRLKEESRLSPLLEIVLRYCLKQAQRSINYQDQADLNRARIFGNLRQIFNLLGQRLSDAGALNHPREVFLLSIEELMAFVYGHGWAPSLKNRIKERSAEAQQWESQPPRDHLLTQGPVGLNLIPPQPNESLRQTSSLWGTGCAPGTIKGEVLILKHSRQAGDLRGKIVVVENTDPGWVFALLSASGLIIEKDKRNSHIALLGREWGIPTIVGAAQVTQRLENGQKVTINGQSGEIKLDSRRLSQPTSIFA
jgi:rifampicin phosphotransferase